MQTEPSPGCRSLVHMVINKSPIYLFCCKHYFRYATLFLFVFFFVSSFTGAVTMTLTLFELALLLWASLTFLGVWLEKWDIGGMWEGRRGRANYS